MQISCFFSPLWKVFFCTALYTETLKAFLGMDKYKKTLPLVRFAPIFYNNREHFLFVYDVKQKQKRFAYFIKNIIGNRILLKGNF